MNFLKFIRSLLGKDSSEKSKTGIVKFFNRSRGYGFIHSEETNNRVFVHISELKDRIRPGDHVKFEIKEGDKGPRAKNVKLVAEAG